MNRARPAKSGRALLCQTKCVTHPRLKATSRPVKMRDELGVPSASENTPRQKPQKPLKLSFIRKSPHTAPAPAAPPIAAPRAFHNDPTAAPPPAHPMTLSTFTIPRVL